MARAEFISLGDEFQVERITYTSTALLVEMVSRTARACCPLCRHVAQRRHSCYTRRIADLPSAGRHVKLAVTVRKFLCQNPGCPRQIFAERFPEFALSSARRTNRLLTVLCALGLVAGGEPGTRLAAKLGIQTSSSTLLRCLMRLPLPTLPPIRILGVDDWSWKKGRRYGTILVDLERHHVVDLLEDRCRSTFAEWLHAHPEVEIISRDRATDYAAAAREAAPQVVQIADRFHLVRNLADAIERLLARCRGDVRRTTCPAGDSAERVSDGSDSHLGSLPGPETWRPQYQANVEVLFQTRQAQREDRFQQAMLLRQHGLPLVQIARRVGRSERTIRTWLRRGTAPTYKQTRKRHSTFDPYAAYALDRWQAGVQDGKQLYDELVAHGYTGSVRTVQRFISILLPDRRPLVDLVPPSPLDQFSAREVVWLFLRDPAELSAEEAERVALIRRASALVDTAYSLAQAFVRMLRHRHGEQLAGWLDAVQTSQIAELQRFAGGILKDYDAVLAGLTWNYSNGPVEAQVHKLKLVKRAMFGRAKLPLLRQRLIQIV